MTQQNNTMKCVGFAWIGTLGTWTLIETAQVWVGLGAGVLTCIYTGLKIYDWFRERVKKPD